MSLFVEKGRQIKFFVTKLPPFGIFNQKKNLLLALVDVCASFTKVKAGIGHLLDTFNSEKSSVFVLDVVGSLVSGENTFNVQTTVFSNSTSHFYRFLKFDELSKTQNSKKNGINVESGIYRTNSLTNLEFFSKKNLIKFAWIYYIY